MGKPLMIQAEDEERIENLKKKLRAKTKVEVLRAGLRLLEQETERIERIHRWKRSASIAAQQSTSVNRDFRRYSRFKRS